MHTLFSCKLNPAVFHYVYDVIIWNIWYNGKHGLFSLPRIGLIWSCLSFKAIPEQCVLFNCTIFYSVHATNTLTFFSGPLFTHYTLFCLKAGVNGLDHHVENVERQKTEPMDTVFVRQVAPSGPADRAGLSTGMLCAS